MFTGIIEETGSVVSFAKGDDAWKLELNANVALQEVALGDSIAVNGCCLTVARIGATGAGGEAVGGEAKARAGGGTVGFDVLEETRRLTNLATLTAGSRVNLERSLRFGGKIGGHFVTGHVDGVGTIEVFEPRGGDHYLRVQAPAGMGRYLIHKGSIAIDGISLTVAEVEGDAFAVWLIPTTLDVTNLKTRRAGEAVNLEFDLLGKYVEKLTLSQRA